MRRCRSFDFSKAFDKMCHVKLLGKLQQAGIHPLIIRWIKDFLTERTISAPRRSAVPPYRSIFMRLIFLGGKLWSKL
ncbi:hypothetical protein OSTOST_14483 [Ostertagia ostertagi]